MAKKQCCDAGQKKSKNNVQVAPNVVAVNQRTIRRAPLFRYLFKNRTGKVSFNFSRC